MPGVRVLVIEDEMEVAATLLDVLTEREHQVITVTTAEEGTKIIPSFRPQVLLLDISLPRLSGPGLIEVFGKAYPRLPVIVVTSAVDPDVLARIRDLKPFHLVHKPFDVDALDRLIRSAAEGSPTRR